MSTPVFLLLEHTAKSDPTPLITQLSTSSQLRLAQQKSDERKREFILGRWLMATAASRVIGHAIHLHQIDDRGAFPILPGHPDLHASISHSRDLLGIIVSQPDRIGLDIEYTGKPRNYQDLALRAFHPEEAAFLRTLTGAAQGDAFYRIWTWREAAFKAGLTAHVVGGAPLHSYNYPAQSGKTGDFFWAAVSTTSFCISPEMLVYPPS